MQTSMISSKARLGVNVTIGYGSIIHSNVVVGDGSVIGNYCVLGHEGGRPLVIGKETRIGDFVTLRPNVELGDRVCIESYSVVGYDALTRIWDDRILQTGTRIGSDTHIRAHCSVYAHTQLGSGCKIGHSAILREGLQIGDRVVIGCLVKCEGYSQVGSNSTIHAQTHLTSFMCIEDYVFMGPSCVTMNDPDAAHFRPRRRSIRGPYIAKGARIGSGAILCPGVRIGAEAFVAAGSLVNREIPSREVWAGNPIVKVRDVHPKEFLCDTQNFKPTLHRGES